jgi:hypothetical protein
MPETRRAALFGDWQRAVERTLNWAKPDAPLASIT